MRGDPNFYPSCDIDGNGIINYLDVGTIFSHLGEKRWYCLTISAGSGGTTVPTPGTYEYDEEPTVEVTAIADGGYSFDYWVLDGATKYDNPITVTMNSDHTLNAYFQYDGGGGGGGHITNLPWSAKATPDL